MKTIEVLQKYQEEILKIYNENGLNSLKGIDLNYELDGKNLLVLYFDAVRKLRVSNQNFDADANLDDLLFISDEILFFTANVYLHRPFVNDPIQDSFQTNEEMLFPNFQNLAAMRYHMFIDVVYQNLFNYWDRIGNLIAAFFPEKFKSKNVHFSSAIDSCGSEYTHLSSFMWLKDYRENGFRKLNETRRNVVHRKSTDTFSKYAHLDVTHDEEGIKNWINQRNDLPEYFKGEIQNSFLGLANALFFVEELTKDKLSHIS